MTMYDSIVIMGIKSQERCLKYQVNFLMCHASAINMLDSGFGT